MYRGVIASYAFHKFNVVLNKINLYQHHPLIHVIYNQRHHNMYFLI